MSKFIDKLKQASQAAPQSMGFRAAPTASSKPQMLLVASLAKADKNLAEYVAGADAGLLIISKLSSGTKAIKKLSRAVADIPWGAWLKDTDSEVKPMGKVNYDFMVFPATTSLAVIQNEEVGKILEIETSLDEGLLKAVDELPVDAVLVGDNKKEGLTWHHLMLFQHFSELLTKPLLASIPSEVTANELQALWEAGVNGVIVEAGAGQPVGRVGELRRTIDKLAYPSPRKRRQATGALLPYIGSESAAVTEEEED